MKKEELVHYHFVYFADEKNHHSTGKTFSGVAFGNCIDLYNKHINKEIQAVYKTEEPFYLITE